MIKKELFSKLFGISGSSFYNYINDRANRPIVDLVDRYLLDADVIEFLESGRILKFEKLDPRDEDIINFFQLLEKNCLSFAVAKFFSINRDKKDLERNELLFYIAQTESYTTFSRASLLFSSPPFAQIIDYLFTNRKNFSDMLREPRKTESAFEVNRFLFIYYSANMAQAPQKIKDLPADVFSKGPCD